MRKTRHIELDFLRGFALLLILVDHIGGSVLSRATLHAYALCDASEMFVFVGGLSAALAYDKLCSRAGSAVARERLLRRAAQLYVAFLATAGLMLLIAACLDRFAIDAPNLPSSDLDDLFDTPFGTALDIALLRRQPYLAAVLPMYVCFAACAAWVLPFVRSKPLAALAGSFALWIAAAPLARWLPGLDGAPWDFNPFAWQFLYVLGALAYRFDWTAFAQLVRTMRALSVAALLAAAAGAYARLHFDALGAEPTFKQNLALLRVVNFGAVAWLAWHAARRGWLERAARMLPGVSVIGRHGLACFIAGAGISLVVDSLLYTATDGYMDWPRGLLADAVALAALYATAHLCERWKGRRASTLARVAASTATAGAAE